MTACRRCTRLETSLRQEYGELRRLAHVAERSQSPAKIPVYREQIARQKEVIKHQKQGLEAHRAECEVLA